MGAAGAWGSLRERVPRLGGACGAYNKGIWVGHPYVYLWLSV